MCSHSHDEMIAIDGLDEFGNLLGPREGWVALSADVPSPLVARFPARTRSRCTDKSVSLL